MMWRYLAILYLCSAVTQQAMSSTSKDNVRYSKFDYTNQTMGDLDLPEENYSPSNFYSVSLTRKQRMVYSSDEEHI